MIDIFDYPSENDLYTFPDNKFVKQNNFSMTTRNIKLVITDTEKQIIHWYTSKYEIPYDLTAIAFVASKGDHLHRLKLIKVLWPWSKGFDHKPDPNSIS